MAGCYRDYNGEIETTPVLCINSLITAGEPIEVSVTHTWSYPDDRYVHNSDEHYDNKVTDASVEIFVNRQRVSSDYLPKEGDHIKIVALSRKYGKAEGEITVPFAIPINSAKWEATKRKETEFSFDFSLNFKLTVADDADTENFYHISYSAVKDNYSPDEDILYNVSNLLSELTIGELKYQSEPIFSEHIGMLDALIGNDAYGFTFFTDRRFTGDSYTLNMEFDNASLYLGTDTPADSDLDWSVVFTLSTVSKSYYNLVVYQWQSHNGSIADIGDMGLGNPVWGYSNVSSGAGVIAAQSKSTYKIDLIDFFLSQMEQ